jgi:hypothetical protein
MIDDCVIEALLEIIKSKKRDLEKLTSRQVDKELSVLYGI